MNTFSVAFILYNGFEIHKTVQCNHAHEAAKLAAIGHTWYAINPAVEIFVKLIK